jgi:hypothetical protein
MSDTTSFLGGAALAGLAALVVLKGGISLGSPSATMPPTFSMPQVPGFSTNAPTAGTMPLPNPGGGAIGSSERGYEEAKQHIKQEQLQAQLEQLQQKINSQQAMIDTLTAQSKFSQQQLAPNPPLSPQGVPQIVHPYGSGIESSSNSVMSGLPWALGGVLLTFGGGIALVGMFTLFARQQRPNRTVEYFQEDYPSYLPPQRRRVQVLPPRRVVKRVNLEDEE